MLFFRKKSNPEDQTAEVERQTLEDIDYSNPNTEPSKAQNERFYFWTRPGTSRREVKLVQKLDLCVLTFCCLTFFTKDLDRNNITNAYVDLGLYGNQLNWFTTWFQIGYIVGQIPSQILLTKVSPRYFLPAFEFMWAFLVLFMYKANNATTIYALRFFVGFCEAASWPGLHFMIGTWYRNHEINKRAGIFTAAGIAATMFSGYIQSGIYETMDGHLGLRGWRWLFIIDFLITCPMVIIGLILIPDPLYEKKSWWMTEEERQMCMRRLEADERKPLGRFDLSLFKRVLGRWHFWILVTAFSLQYFAYQAPTTSTMALWLKADGRFSVPQINNLPTVYSAVSIVFMLVSGAYNDCRGTQMHSLLFICATLIISTSILVKWDVSDGAKFFAFYIAGTIQSMFPILVSWAHRVCAGDAEERAIVIGSMNSIGLAHGTWWNQVFVPTVEAPRFSRGYKAGLAASLALTAWMPVIWWFSRNQERNSGAKPEHVLEGSSPDLSEAENGSAGSTTGEKSSTGQVGIREREEKAAETGIVM